MQVNIDEVRADFPKLLKLVETKRDTSITVARNGKPVAKIVPYESAPVSKRIGAAKGKFTVPDDFDAGNEEIASMLLGDL